ncbi:MAG: hypothetical protein AAGF06_04940 [Pseudomonadota bacterium]
MKDTNQMLDHTLQKTQTSSADTAIKAGPTDSIDRAHLDQVKQAVIEVFAQFELVFHNQYNKAFPTADKENLAKKLWFNHLKHYPAAAIMKATDITIRSSEFLPSIYSLLKHLEHDDSLPNAHDAYLECCSSSSPKAKHPWSHPIVYWTGKACGWHVLSTQSEQYAWPLFKERYEQHSKAFAQGQRFDPPQHHDSELMIARDNALDNLPDTANGDDTLRQLKDLFGNPS